MKLSSPRGALHYLTVPCPLLGPKQTSLKRSLAAAKTANVLSDLPRCCHLLVVFQIVLNRNVVS